MYAEGLIFVHKFSVILAAVLLGGGDWGARAPVLPHKFFQMGDARLDLDTIFQNQFKFQRQNRRKQGVFDLRFILNEFLLSRLSLTSH